MSGHTPGPWMIAPFNHDETDPLDVVSGYREIGDGHVGANWIAEVHLETDDAENLANARLISAAPDLYAAASLANERIAEMSQSFKDSDPRWKVCAEVTAALGVALLKAEGR